MRITGNFHLGEKLLLLRIFFIRQHSSGIFLQPLFFIRYFVETTLGKVTLVVEKVGVC